MSIRRVFVVGPKNRLERARVRRNDDATISNASRHN